jgi:hypothetical protein
MNYRPLQGYYTGKDHDNRLKSVQALSRFRRHGAAKPAAKRGRHSQEQRLAALASAEQASGSAFTQALDLLTSSCPPMVLMLPGG